MITYGEAAKSYIFSDPATKRGGVKARQERKKNFFKLEKLRQKMGPQR